jgi:phosphate:Na+ symporter
MSLPGALAALLGGFGLFMLGMWLMSEGLKVAAGTALRRILAGWTRTPLRAVLAGTGLTALVQSSSAVTVATVGFVNAGLLTLHQAIGVIYGSNIGTTMTGWIVAVTGVEIKLDAYALPAIGLGMILRMTGAGTRRAAAGQALAGFALFLLGIQALKSNFSALAGHVDFSTLPTEGIGAIVVYFAIGVVLTLLIQSSSATIAIVMAATAAGIVPVPLAALVIIGADLGTSSTAAIAGFGGGANARRTAMSHVLFNIVTTSFAVATLPWLLAISEFIRNTLALPDNAAMVLAIFSTLFNIIGVLLMIPLTGHMARFLEKRFRSVEDEIARPRHLHETQLADVALARHALVQEVQRLGQLSLAYAREGLHGGGGAVAALQRRHAALESLGDQIGAYIGRLRRDAGDNGAAADLAALLRCLHHYEEVTDLTFGALAPDAVPAEDATFAQAVENTLGTADPLHAGFNKVGAEQAYAALEALYQQTKRELLQAAAEGRLDVESMDRRMQMVARQRRIAERAVKAAARLAPLLAGPAAV